MLFSSGFKNLFVTSERFQNGFCDDIFSNVIESKTNFCFVDSQSVGIKNVFSFN